MRIATVIIGITAIAVCLVMMRREDVRLRHELQKIQTQHAAVKRDIWDRHVEMGHLLTPASIRFRADAMALNLIQISNAKVVEDSSAATPTSMPSSSGHNQRNLNEPRR
ncbi:MAG TPA: hypothetical protein PKK48_01660 [Phycisphaerae bacterium]|nr:hypothetical protein [Phycisphaerae bacterium]